MDAMTLALPKEYGYVLLTATLSSIVAYYHTFNTASYRKAAKIPYPNAYASAAEAKESKAAYLFNCAQRAHANYQERHPSFLIGLIVGGLRYPVLSAGLGAAWCAARVGYTWGYCRADKEKGSGRVSWVGVASIIEVTMTGLSAFVGYKMVMP